MFRFYENSFSNIYRVIEKFLTRSKFISLKMNKILFHVFRHVILASIILFSLRLELDLEFQYRR